MGAAYDPHRSLRLSSRGGLRGGSHLARARGLHPALHRTFKDVLRAGVTDRPAAPLITPCSRYLGQGVHLLREKIVKSPIKNKKNQ